MDFAACCMSPGIAPFVDTPPGSNGLPPGHALGPSARPCFALTRFAGHALCLALPPSLFELRRGKLRFAGHCAPAFVALVPRPPDVPSVIRELSGPAS